MTTIGAEVEEAAEEEEVVALNPQQPIRIKVFASAGNTKGCARDSLQEKIALSLTLRAKREQAKAEARATEAKVKEGAKATKANPMLLVLPHAQDKRN